MVAVRHTMSGGHAKKPIAVYGALVANLAIAVTKFIAAAASGSSAMLAEGIHSVIDTGNELLLLLGTRRSQKPPDEEHPFGHGKELYFWGLLVAVVLFGAGGGMSTFEGISELVNPAELHHSIWSYVVLGVAALFEGGSFFVAYRELKKGKKKASLFRRMQLSKDPSVYTVTAEDSAALLGLLFAFTGLLVSELTDSPVPDAIASLAIGLLLCSVAVFLVVETRGLLVGESASRDLVEHVRRIASRERVVARAEAPLTMHLGPHEVLLGLPLEFTRGTNVAEAHDAVERIEHAVREEHPEVRRILVDLGPVGGDKR